MTEYVHLNGELVSADDANVNVRDRGFLYGDGLFETLRAYGGTIFAWPKHAERLEHGCDRIDLRHGLTREDLRRRIEETLEANDLDDAYVRLSITRGTQSGRLTPAPTADPTVVVLVEPLPPGGSAGEAVWDGPAHCVIADTRKIPSAAIPAFLKSHNYLNGILARLEARTQDADEVIMLDMENAVSEGATSNVFFVADGVLHTPDSDMHPLLPGVTRAIVLELAAGLEIPTRTGTYRVDDLTSAEEVFLTNTTWELRPVASLEATTYAVGPITEQLQAAYCRRVDRSCYPERSQAN